MKPPHYVSLSVLTHETTAKDLRDMGDHTIVLHRNKPIAVLVPFDLYLEWQAVLHPAMTPASPTPREGRDETY